MNVFKALLKANTSSASSSPAALSPRAVTRPTLNTGDLSKWGSSGPLGWSFGGSGDSLSGKKDPWSFGTGNYCPDLIDLTATETGDEPKLSVGGQPKENEVHRLQASPLLAAASPPTGPERPRRQIRAAPLKALRSLIWSGLDCLKALLPRIGLVHKIGGSRSLQKNLCRLEDMQWVMKFCRYNSHVLVAPWQGKFLFERQRAIGFIRRMEALHQLSLIGEMDEVYVGFLQLKRQLVHDGVRVTPGLDVDADEHAYKNLALFSETFYRAAQQAEAEPLKHKLRLLARWLDFRELSTPDQAIFWQIVSNSACWTRSFSRMVVFAATGQLKAGKQLYHACKHVLASRREGLRQEPHLADGHV